MKKSDCDGSMPRPFAYRRQDNFVVVHAEIHNKRDELQKVFDVKKLDRVDGIWTVLEMVMADSARRTRTELVVEQAEYNVGLKESDFSPRELERGSGR